MLFRSPVLNKGSDLEENIVVYSDDVIKWVEKQGLTVDRFFYLEERVKLAVRACIVKQENHRKILNFNKRLLNIVDSDAMKDAINREIAMAEKAHLVFNITEEELDIVCPNIEVIEPIVFAE